VARQLGVSLKRFTGWEPRQVTKVLSWTSDGKPAVWETRVEPEWDSYERSLMLALDWWESGLCQRCGHHLDETTDPDTDPDNPAAKRTWLADGPYECFACKTLYQAEKKWGKEAPDTAQISVWSAVLVDR